MTTLISLLVCASALCAQEPALAPGSALLRTSQIRPGVDSFRIESHREGKLWRSATLIRSVSRAGDEFVFAQTYRTPEGTTVDTSWVNAKTLAPARYFADVFGEIQRFTFTGKEGTGTVVPKDSAARPVRVQASAPFFNAVAIDLVYAALPLASGFIADLPLYNPPRMQMAIKLRVVGEESLERIDGGKVAAWVLDYQMGPMTQKLWLDRETGELLRIGASQAGNAFYKYRADLKSPTG
ncbi:MAG: hypothetical protein WEE89_02310 [Gemmatimonadota bacterium]